MEAGEDVHATDEDLDGEEGSQENAEAADDAGAGAPGAHDDEGREHADRGGDEAVGELEGRQQMVDVRRERRAVHQRPVLVGEAGALAGDRRTQEQEDVGGGRGRGDQLGE